jgi:hypothetical protein
MVVDFKRMWQKMWAYQTITNNPCPRINSDLLLVSRMSYMMRILFCPLVLVVNITDAISTKCASSVKSTDETNSAQHFVEQMTDKSSLAWENQQA